MGAIPNILSSVTVLPLVGALRILIGRLTTKTADGLARWVALITPLATLAVSCVLVAQFDPSSAARPHRVVAGSSSGRVPRRAGLVTTRCVSGFPAAVTLRKGVFIIVGSPSWWGW